MADEWDAVAGGWDDNPDVRRYADLAFGTLEGLGPGLRVLDFGCGTGLLTERIARHVGEVVAVDTSAAMVERLRAKGLAGVRALHLDILAGDALPERFDLILASSVCAFVPDYPAAVVRLAGLLASGGRFVQWDWQALGDGTPGLTEARIEGALAEAGLGGVTVKHAFDMEAGGMRMPVLMGVGTRV